jgi:hypothetical protein
VLRQAAFHRHTNLGRFPMSTLLASIDPGLVVELLKDNGDGTGRARLVQVAEWEEAEPGTEVEILLSGFEELPQ